MPGDRATIDVEGRAVGVTNLGKVLYPADGTTKGAVLDHYAALAPVLLPHLRDRPCTRIRWPNGVEQPSFYEKNAPRGTPDWVRTVRLDSPGSTRDREVIDYVVVDDLATLIWSANLAALELHVPQWRLTRDDRPAAPDRLVVDLDPGPPADIVTCARVALVVRELLDDDGLTAFPCTSGSKGMQLYVPVRVRSVERVQRYAARLAERVSARLPADTVPTMTRAARAGKIYVDHGQNHPGKTTISPYSLRGRERARVATPLAWSELTDVGSAEALTFTSAQVRERVARDGDLLAPLLGPTAAGRLPD
jgi:bifunctional non-homologous end joining protein LigD